MKQTIQRNIIGLVLICILCLSVSGVTAADWPQWRGPVRDGLCKETALLQTWPEGGPELLWSMRGAGAGFSSVAIADGKLYTVGDMDLRDEMIQCLTAFDLGTHKRLWATTIGAAHTEHFSGPRSTPTIDGELVYAIGTEGYVAAVNTDTGDMVWKKHLLNDLGGASNIFWKFTESPTVDGEKLICTPGGRKAVMVALNKKTGEVIWTCSMPNIGDIGQDQAGYSSIVIAEAAGVKQYIQLTNKGLIGVAADSGKFLWGYNRIANRAAGIPTPVVFGDYVFCSNGYSVGSALLKLEPDNGGVTAKEVYFLNADTFSNHHGGFVKVGDYIYGGHGQMKGAPTCVQAMTGKIQWQAEQPAEGSAAVLYADGNLIFRYEDGTVALIEASPEKFTLKSRFKPETIEGMADQAWAHPVISDGKLYLRHADVIQCYDVKG